MKVSVVIPCYNSEEFVGEAVEGALKQTFPSKEVLVIDDGSTDESAKVARKKGARVVRLKKNRGIGAARHRGALEAKGEFMCYCSADDVLEPTYIKEMLEAANANDFFFSDYVRWDRHGVQRVAAPFFQDYKDLVLRAVWEARHSNMFICYNLFGATQLFREHNFCKSLRFGEDLEHLLRCMLVENVKFRHVPKPLFAYRVHPKMVTQQKRGEIKANNEKIFRKINALVGRKVF